MLLVGRIAVIWLAHTIDIAFTPKDIAVIGFAERTAAD